jgi:oxygen-independent coproporphyrinogen-3 oxidase
MPQLRKFAQNCLTTSAVYPGSVLAPSTLCPLKRCEAKVQPTYELSESERVIYRQFAALNLPRHTSYPAVTAWQEGYQTNEFLADLAAEAALGQAVSLYVHVPFCQKLCFYCACNKLVIPKDHEHSQPYSTEFLAAVKAEISLQAKQLSLGKKPRLAQLHLGGGTPTYLDASLLTELLEHVFAQFELTAGAELAAEIDPRVTSAEQLQTLRRFGFNRLSLGVQDFDDEVQQAIGRSQPFDQVDSFVKLCRDIGFESINFDLIYGLPFQTLDTMKNTLDRVVQLAPDRIAFYRLALIPEVFRWQRRFRPTDIPDGDLPLDLNLLAIHRFTAAGYRFIGLDHFAKPQEALALAHADGSIRRSFQGMTTGGDLAVVGAGPSAISALSRSYAQNRGDFKQWANSIAAGQTTERGIRLSEDDLIRRWVLHELYCYRRITPEATSSRFGIDFSQYFAREVATLNELQSLGLVTQTASPTLPSYPTPATAWELKQPLGHLLVRIVAAVFDAHIPPDAWRNGVGALASKVG